MSDDDGTPENAAALDTGGLVEWQDWGSPPFERAVEEGKPVLLSLSAPWCAACHEMDRTTYTNPQLAAHVSDGFVPVRADVDRQPRVRERYNMGGFPSTVFCTPDGRVLTGAGYMSEAMLRGALDSVRETWDAKGSEAGRVPRALQDPDPPAGQVDAGIEAHMVEQVAASFDEEFGGWGNGAKFPLPRAIEFAAKRDSDRATRTLEAVGTHLLDTYDGGFYRFATERDWSNPHREKLLDENAALIRAFATGYLYTGVDSYRETAERTLDYVTTDLWTGDGFAASQAGGDYFTLEATERESAAPPHVDGTVFADRNGLAADALLRYAAYTDDERARQFAKRALDHVLDTLVAGGEIRHFDSPAAETDLLLDTSRVLAGLTAGTQLVGDNGYAAAAEEIADRAIDTLQAPEGAFFDGPREGPGLLDRPLRPLEANVELANALIDLAYLSEKTRYRDVADETLSAFAGAADRMGVEVAGYATACTRHHYDPLVIETPAAGSDLHRAAWRVADHEKVVVPGVHDSRAVVIRDDERRAAETPSELMDRAGETGSLVDGGDAPL